MIRKSISKRIIEILDYLYTCQPNEKVTQSQIMEAIGCSRGQWNETKDWLELIFKVQAAPIERDFKQIGKPNGKGRIVTLYYREG